MKYYLLLCLLIVTPAIAKERNSWIDEMVKRGDIALTFKPNGDLNTVTCNTKKYTTTQCEHAGNYIFDYYRKFRKS